MQKVGYHEGDGGVEKDQERDAEEGDKEKVCGDLDSGCREWRFHESHRDGRDDGCDDGGDEIDGCGIRSIRSIRSWPTRLVSM